MLEHNDPSHVNCDFEIEVRKFEGVRERHSTTTPRDIPANAKSFDFIFLFLNVGVVSRKSVAFWLEAFVSRVRDGFARFVGHRTGQSGPDYVELEQHIVT